VAIRNPVPILLAAACLLGPGCSTREPSYVSPHLGQLGVTTFAVAPIIDARPDAFHNVDVLAQVRRSVDNALTAKGYAAVPADLKRGGQRLTSGEIAGMSNSELAAAAKGDPRHLLIISVEDVQRDVGELGKTIRVKLGGRLIDLDTHQELWRDIAEGDADLSGLLTVLTGPAPEYEAALDAARTLFSTLPDSPERPHAGSKASATEAGTKREAEGLRPTQER